MKRSLVAGLFCGVAALLLGLFGALPSPWLWIPTCIALGMWWGDHTMPSTNGKGH
jgi:hypothetical protein